MIVLPPNTVFFCLHQSLRPDISQSTRSPLLIFRRVAEHEIEYMARARTIDECLRVAANLQTIGKTEARRFATKTVQYETKI